ncbi:SNF2 family N-terminal domain containing protein [Tritrichomonas foetus]|uniref:SNF2 family N-terminal domain containing protein n=1 Tax=Tritrichomonas foetus TaxID=1144522 RepID=A0A1J4KSC3_9EUKA|nr:SNF2 family N-terminal domain containing protein [Tritrichomonas foetus]|eukprot:OHT13784.1 SNF2 family N-terminal domain containing protein [Tritrichomonas foetus]
MAQLNGSMFPQNQQKPNPTDKPPSSSVFTIPIVQQSSNSFENYSPQSMNFNQPMLYQPQNPISQQQSYQQSSGINQQNSNTYMQNSYQQQSQPQQQINSIMYQNSMMPNMMQQYQLQNQSLNQIQSQSMQQNQPLNPNSHSLQNQQHNSIQNTLQGTISNSMQNKMSNPIQNSMTNQNSNPMQNNYLNQQQNQRQNQMQNNYLNQQQNQRQNQMQAQISDQMTNSLSGHVPNQNFMNNSLQNSRSNPIHTQIQNNVNNYQNNLQTNLPSPLQNNSMQNNMQMNISNTSRSNNFPNTIHNNMQSTIQNCMQNNQMQNNSIQSNSMQNNPMQNNSIQNNPIHNNSIQNNLKNTLQNSLQNNLPSVQSGLQNTLQSQLTTKIQNSMQNPMNNPLQSLTQMMSMNQYQPTMQPNPVFLEYYKKFATSQMQQSFSQINFKQRQKPVKPPPDPNEPPKKRGRPRKNEEFQPPKPKNKAKNENSDDFEAFADDYIPKDLMACRTVVRENRRHINYAEDEADDDFDEEEGTTDNKRKSTKRLEHIYALRRKETGVEYLVKFPDSMSSALCQWIPESQMGNYVNSKSLLQRAPLDITDISENSPNLLIVAHKRVENGFIYLYKFTYETNVIFFWDVASDNIARAYFNNRIKVPLINPGLPMTQLPPPNTRTIVSRQNNEMREYQVQGLTWLLKCWHSGHGSILADEMGLGKTIQILSFLSYLDRYAGWHGPFLITVRTNCFKQWCDEIERWTNLKYIAYNSGPAQRAMMRDCMFPCLDDNGNPIPNCISFNILLVSYDVFLKDISFLNKYLWEVLVVDEGHRIKNSTGKKNRAMSDLKAKQRIILTGTPIQNSLTELWTLLRFVSPNYFQDTLDFLEFDVDKLDKETVIKARNMILPHLMRRSLAEAEHTIAPKEERVAFISLTQPQKDMIRLIKLHKLWRIKGVQTSEVEMDSSHETNAISKVCSHPFLVDGAEEFYSKKLKLPRLELILATSSKFQWLDKVLQNLHAEGHKVLIFSQRVKLLKLLNEYCQLRNFPNQMLIGSMGETEKNAAIAQFSAKDSKDFVFLISTRAGSEGLNLTVANITIIFDPDWNPQNDLQAQGRCHRIGQTQKVDVLRLITYQTYEHEMFVRAQRKLGLWLTLLGSKPLDVTPNNDGLEEPPLLEPPQIPDIDATTYQLNDLLENISTVATDFSLSALDRLGAPLSQPIDFSDGTPDEVFIETFPVEIDDGSSRRTKRSRSRELTLNIQSARLVYEQLKIFGYGQIEPISAYLIDHGMEQVERFAITLIVFAFRALPPQNLSYFPVLINQILNDYPEFQFKMLCCANKNHWMDLFENEHEMDIDIQPIQFLRDELFSSSTEFLSIIEMKLIARYWLQLGKPFPFDTIPPVSTDSDEELFNKIISNETFDPFLDRVLVIINQMRGDLILNQLDSCAYHFPWWSEPEFQAILASIRNFHFSTENPTAFHAKTGLLSKTTTEIVAFAAQLRRMIGERKKGQIIIPKSLHKITEAPSSLMNLKGFSAWTTLQIRECDELRSRIDLLASLKSTIDEMRSLEEIQPLQETEYWSQYQEKKFLELINEYGIDFMRSILIDKRFGFYKHLSVNDEQFLNGEKPRRNPGTSDVPDFVFNEIELGKYLSRNEANRPPANNSDDEWRVEFALPHIKKLIFSVTSAPRKKKKSANDDADNFVLGRYKSTTKRKKKIESDSDDIEPDDF